jgi:hypothetical protein
MGCPKKKELSVKIDNEPPTLTTIWTPGTIESKKNILRSMGFIQIEKKSHNNSSFALFI